jgi:hypothetical protein
MSDFCRQCSLSLFHEDSGDLAHLGDDSPLESGTGYLVLCEGCGYTLVDNDGNCIDPNCLEHHGEEIRPSRERDSNR